MAYQLKIASFVILITNIAIKHSSIFADILSKMGFDKLPIYTNSLLSIAGGLLIAVGIGFWESVCARRKWTWVPEIMGVTFLFLLVIGTLVKIK
jgi:hypothetical protein